MLIEPPVPESLLGLTNLRRQVEELTREREAWGQEWDSLRQERDSLIQERDIWSRDRGALVQERDALIIERNALKECADVMANLPGSDLLPFFQREYQTTRLTEARLSRQVTVMELEVARMRELETRVLSRVP